MKILYCNPSFWNYRLPFYEKLNELFGGEFHVIYSTKRYRGNNEKMLPAILERLGENAHPYDNELMYDVKARSFDAFTEGGKQIPMPFGLIPRIAKIKPDVLITEAFFQWTPWVLLYAIFHRVPVFMGYERTPWTERNSTWVHKWHRKLTDKFIKGYLVNGSETKKYLMSIGVKEEKIHIGGMSADSEGLRKGIGEFQKESESFNEFQNRYKKDGGLMYLFTGALIERKGIIPLLDAWKDHVKRYPNDSLVVVGIGELYDKCVTEYDDMPSIFFEGRIQYEEIHRYYAIADVYILPTIEDNWSLVIPEAMACGLPVATSIYNGCHVELIKDGVNGFVFDTFKYETIVEVLDKFHDADLEAMGKASLEIEKDFNTEACAKREYEAICICEHALGDARRRFHNEAEKE